jgi:hypothetical protein
MHLNIHPKLGSVIVKAINFVACLISQRKRRDSSVGIALGYGLDDQGYRVRFPAESGKFSLHNGFQNGSGAHAASYTIGTRDSFTGGKVAGA